MKILPRLIIDLTKFRPREALKLPNTRQWNHLHKLPKQTILKFTSHAIRCQEKNFAFKRHRFISKITIDIDLKIWKNLKYQGKEKSLALKKGNEIKGEKKHCVVFIRVSRENDERLGFLNKILPSLFSSG